MSRRLLASYVTLTIVVLAALEIPLGIQYGRSEQRDLTNRIVRDALVMATFAEDPTERCSGLPVARYRAAELHAVFGADYELLESTRETHRTPGGAEQHFTWIRMRRVR